MMVMNINVNRNRNIIIIIATKIEIMKVMVKIIKRSSNNYSLRTTDSLTTF